MMNILFIQIPLIISKWFLSLFSFLTGKRLDLMYYHSLGRQLDLVNEVNGIKFDASYKTPWSRAERLFSKEPDTIHWIKVGVPMGYHIIKPDYSLVLEKINAGYEFISFSLDTLFLGTACRDQIKRLREESR